MTTEHRFIIEKKEDGSLIGTKPLKTAIDGLITGRHIFTIAKYKKRRSLPQNSFYHGIVVNCVKDGLIGAGFNPSELSNEIVHEMLKAKFLKQDIANDDGQFITIVKSTAELTTTEFMDYISEIQQWGAEFLSIIIPDPGEQGELDI